MINFPVIYEQLPAIEPGQKTTVISLYTDVNGDKAAIPAGFTVSSMEGENRIKRGLVIRGEDESEFVWIPTYVTPLGQRDFGCYMYGGNSLRGYRDDASDEYYQAMKASCEKYGGFYLSRYEASYGSGRSIDDYVPASKKDFFLYYLIVYNNVGMNYLIKLFF